MYGGNTMRKIKKTVSISALLLTGWAIIASGAALRTVQVREAQLRSTPSFLGKLTGTCAYGTKVTAVATQGDWEKVHTTDGKEGWVNLQAGTPTATTAASGDELALAGKGFNSDVEAEFKRRNSEIDFDWVDRMEKISISSEQMQAFLKAGGVQPQAGGAQ
jgi:uncharacterized protein YgiM (DUF1202 family)